VNSNHNEFLGKAGQGCPGSRIKNAPQTKKGCGAGKDVGLLKSVGDVGQQSDLTSALDGLGQLTLVHSASAGGSPGQDLGALGEEAAQLGSVLIIDVLNLIDTESTDLTAFTAAARAFSIHSHDSKPP
jgi:hypothetical protein